MYQVRSRKDRNNQKMKVEGVDSSSFRREESRPPIITEAQRNDLKKGQSVRQKPGDVRRDSSSKKGGGFPLYAATALPGGTRQGKAPAGPLPCAGSSGNF